MPRGGSKQNMKWLIEGTISLAPLTGLEAWSRAGICMASMAPIRILDEIRPRFILRNRKCIQGRFQTTPPWYGLTRFGRATAKAWYETPQFLSRRFDLHPLRVMRALTSNYWALRILEHPVMYVPAYGHMLTCALIITIFPTLIPEE